MKTKLNFKKLMTCALLILPVISMFSLQAQDYLINFTGSGGSTIVDSVNVENLTQGTKLKMKGSDILHLMGVVTGIETVIDNEKNKIGFYPNPMKDYSRMQFVLPEPGEAIITMHDHAGRKIAETRDLLSKGQHTYRILGIEEGTYFVRINSGRYSLNGKLISSGSKNSGARIVFENTAVSQNKQSDSKGTNEEKVMQYTTNDLLKLTGTSASYSTVLTVVPSTNKTITFNFISCTDGDGNNYPVVHIETVKGTRDNLNLAEGKGIITFMAENLKTTKLNDGTPIPLVTSNTEWQDLLTLAYCWYLNSIGYKDTYGALYNWYAVNSGKLCPAGWHVPTSGTWSGLIELLGGAEEAGGKLKETGTTHWKSPNVGARNTDGFTFLPGGYRADNGSSYAMVSYGCCWSSTQSYISCNTGAWYFYLYYNDKTAMIKEKCVETEGYSVRCIKDN